MVTSPLSTSPGVLSEGLPPLRCQCSNEGSPSPCPADGLTSFRSFLRSEFSEENAEFWVACEDYKKTKSPVKMAEKAKKIYEEFIQTEAPKEVSGHGAGDGTRRDEAAALSASIPKDSDGCRAPHATAEGLRGLYPSQGFSPIPTCCTPILHNPGALVCMLSLCWAVSSHGHPQHMPVPPFPTEAWHQS